VESEKTKWYEANKEKLNKLANRMRLYKKENESLKINYESLVLNYADVQCQLDTAEKKMLEFRNKNQYLNNQLSICTEELEVVRSRLQNTLQTPTITGEQEYTMSIIKKETKRSMTPITIDHGLFGFSDGDWSDGEAGSDCPDREYTDTLNIDVHAILGGDYSPTFGSDCETSSSRTNSSLFKHTYGDCQEDSDESEIEWETNDENSFMTDGYDQEILLGREFRSLEEQNGSFFPIAHQTEI
jgi:uncharacterized protein (UPF0305 family)